MYCWFCSLRMIVSFLRLFLTGRGILGENRKSLGKCSGHFRIQGTTKILWNAYLRVEIEKLCGTGHSNVIHKTTSISYKYLAKWTIWIKKKKDANIIEFDRKVGVRNGGNFQISFWILNTIELFDKIRKKKSTFVLKNFSQKLNYKLQNHIGNIWNVH